MSPFQLSLLHPIYKQIRKICQKQIPLSRRQRIWLLYSIDIALFVISIHFSLILRFDTPEPPQLKHSWLMGLLIAIKFLVFHIRGIYAPLLRHAGVELLSLIGQAVLYSSSILIVLSYLLGIWPLSRGVLVIDALLTLFLVTGVRLLLRGLVRQGLRVRKLPEKIQQQPKRVVIYGAGDAGAQLARALLNHPNYRLIRFVDDNPEWQQQYLQGVQIVSADNLPKLWSRQAIDEVILAMPSVQLSRRREILQYLQSLAIPVKTIPDLESIVSGRVSIQEIRDVDITELLGREEVAPDPQLLQKPIKGKAVLVTGAGGSIGSELCRQIAQQQPKCIVLYELNEFALYTIDQELAEKYPTLQRFAYLGNVTHSNHLSEVLLRHQIETVYHAAAYKHVPLVEANIAEGVTNNVLGTLTAAQCAIACQVKHFVLISTDKAVRPTNVMGTSKRIAELCIQSLAARPHLPTCFAIVRFGNVLDSSGSVVPRFRKQIIAGGPITLTHPEITRYFMSIPEAARLVIQAGAMATGGEVFLLDMGDPIRIYDLALQMIYLSGLTPHEDIEIQITGLRPGEKLYEELLIAGENVRPTLHPKIFCAHEQFLLWDHLQPQLDHLIKAIDLADLKAIWVQLKRLVPEYQQSQTVGLVPASRH